MYRKLLKNCSIVSGGLIVSRVSGMVKIAVIAAIFGAGDSMDSFLVAMAIPTAVLTIFGEAAYVAAVKLISRWKSEGPLTAEAHKEVSSLFNFSAVAITAFSLLYWLLAPVLLRLIAPGFTEEKYLQTATLARCVAPVMMLVTIQQIFNAILHAHGRFALPALRVLITNGFAILSVFTLSGEFGIAAYALGNVMGEAVVCLLSYFAARKTGARIVPAWDWHCTGMCQSIRLAVPAMATMGVLQVTVITDRAFASTLPAGSISALGYAMLLFTVPLSLVRTVVDVGFPSIAGLVQGNQEQSRELVQAIRACAKLLLAVSIPVTVMLIAWRQPIVAFLLERGRFDAESAAATASALLFYAFAVLPMVARHFVTRLSQSFGDSITPLVPNIVSTAGNIILNLLLIPHLGHRAIALSLALSTSLGLVLMYFQIRQRIPVFRTCGLEGILFRSLGAGSTMAVGYAVIASMLSTSDVRALIAAVGAALCYACGLAAVGVLRPKSILNLRIS